MTPRSTQINDWRWLGIVLVCGLVTIIGRAAWLWRGNRRQLAIAGSLALWVLLSIAPVYSMFDVSGTLQGSRYVYLASAGWSIRQPIHQMKTTKSKRQSYPHWSGCFPR